MPPQGPEQQEDPRRHHPLPAAAGKAGQATTADQAGQSITLTCGESPFAATHRGTPDQGTRPDAQAGHANPARPELPPTVRVAPGACSSF
ncbi:hypothetical protein ACMAUO_08405 [Gluconacetobacter sp. Hr-1-5]|uniref:hypothetical protein n=1 Tax=Gluconacetobacter sp. Hr-1-5 TaxID=3395370 RepID=UPI003B51C844